MGYTAIFGRVLVRDKYIDRSRRMFRSALTEQEQELLDDPRRALSTTFKKQTPWAERLPDRVCDVLVQEAYQRAAASDGSVRWKGFLSALFAVANVTGQALDGEKIDDLRVKQILEVNRVI
jgi:hypothetical protein